MTPDEFVRKWNNVELNERAAAQSHFIDLCRMLNEPAPTDVDPRGDWYAFERGATKTTGGEGWADVWKRNHFGWEYKGKRKDLKAAFAQLQQYALALENPPLLVVCDMERFEIHTNWTNSVSAVHEFCLDDLRDANVRQRLKWVFSDPEQLKPGKTRQELTEQAAAKFAELAQRLRERKHPAEGVARFINRLVFCMFAEDVDLLPNKMFKRMLQHASLRPEEFQELASDLFRAMQSGGRVGFEHVAWFNGGLFNDPTALPLDRDDISLTLAAARLYWAEIDPSIFGTLFQRGLDPDKRSQLGAHYTDREKIMMIIDPVIVRPWLVEWEATKLKIAEAMAEATAAQQRKPTRQSDAKIVHATARRAEERAKRFANSLFIGFLDRLRRFRVLDPACGSGNFLYLAVLALKDIEHRANIDAELLGLTRQAPGVGPEAVLGIEINPYAAELARVSVWIGELQWMRRNGFGVSDNPILKPLDNIECRDAILNDDGSEALWPPADVVIGNPPFLGDKFMRDRLGSAYATALRKAYSGRTPGGADLVCYWFTKASDHIAAGKSHRAGLVATSSIRGGANRAVLERIVADQHIFEAWSDEHWTVEGANVRVSLICFTSKNAELNDSLNGQHIGGIFADLTAGAIDLSTVRSLSENEGVAFNGISKKGKFDISGDVARSWLVLPANPNGRKNEDVVRPWINGIDVVRRSQDMWLVHFGAMSEADAAMFEAPYAWVRKYVYAERAKSNSRMERRDWWLLARRADAMQSAISPLQRYIATPEVSKHRIFIWVDPRIVPDKNVVVIAREDDTSFGILQSRYHSAWALRTGTSLEDRPRYTSTTTFRTFPFPDGLTPDVAAASYENDPRARQIASAAKKLNQAREGWLNPPDLVTSRPEVVPDYPPRLEPNDAAASAILKERTLTNLYNERPTWLVNAHIELDAAVATAYGWPADISEGDALVRLFVLNQERA
ncbi:MAG: class I SAM-dependent DNA methyltransferase [Alphaproteobacteria bacterium]|nr:class I SAM-dependent DNA methyltransferase [Alphaproteobacteria bacterium]